MNDVYFNVPCIGYLTRSEAIKEAKDRNFHAISHVGITWQGRAGQVHYLNFSDMSDRERKILDRHIN